MALQVVYALPVEEAEGKSFSRLERVIFGYAY
jgi:hypothetical protein